MTARDVPDGPDAAPRRARATSGGPAAGNAASPAAPSELRRRIEGLEADLRSAREEATHLGLENRRLRAVADQAETERLALARLLEPLHVANEEISRLQERHATDLEAARSQHDLVTRALREQLRQAENAAGRVAREMLALRRSLPWRLTRPWRALGRLIRRRRS